MLAWRLRGRGLVLDYLRVTACSTATNGIDLSEITSGRGLTEDDFDLCAGERGRCIFVALSIEVEYFARYGSRAPAGDLPLLAIPPLVWKSRLSYPKRKSLHFTR